ncbi:MAG: zf-HC2 domain-containing protein [Acidobacteriota bacterium]
MNCKRVEALMPLYAGGDIDGQTIGEVRTHVNTCGQCAALAAEYEASRNWLSGATPDLDEALLFDLKRGVMRELQTASSRPGLFEQMKEAFARTAVRPAVAAALLLVVFGALTFWFYLAKPGSPLPIRLTEGAPEQAPRAPSGNESPRAIEPPRSSTGDRHRRRPALAKSHREKRNGAGGGQVSTQVANAMPEPQPPSAVAFESAGVLRIDIQTSDPNIRIIWFAPRQIDSQQTNP